MANADLRMFMDDLKKIIHGNHDPLINNNPLILSKRPQFQLLYQELESIIQTLFTIHEDHHHHQHHELEKVTNLKKRFKDATQEAQYNIDLFLSALHFTNSGVYPRSDVLKTSWNLFLSALHFRDRELSPGSDVFKTSLDLNKILKSIESIKVELKTINIDNMKMDSSSRIDHVKTQSVAAAAAGTSYTRNPLGKMSQSMKEVVVGLDRDAEIIRDKLTEDTKQLSIVSIVGMGGQGKTTLATKLFNDSFLKYHFHIRAWATVSQSYKKRDLLIQILTSIDSQDDLEKDNDSKLREKLHKKLMGRRYLVVIDDIWSIEAWEELKLCFPHDNTASRILLTSRLIEVALHVKPHGFVHSLPCLTDEESWELLKQKVFHGDHCPEWLIEPGRQIARKCHGLPLSVVVMAGVLATTKKDLWENIACSVGSHMISNQKQCMETLALSYHHLPDHLRACFLYLGGFPEDSIINVKKVIRLWVAEGFIEEASNQSFEVTAKAYLMNLIDKNLVIVAKRTFTGDVKSYKLHDLVRELCMQKAKEEEFFLKIDAAPLPSQLFEVRTPYTQSRRVFADRDIHIADFARPRTPCMRSLLCFHNLYSLYGKAENLRSLVLLRVLDLQKYKLSYFPQKLESLIHLRYLAIWISYDFSSSICKLISLQTLIVYMNFLDEVYLPANISNLVNLRHLWSDKQLILPVIEKSMNLQSISTVRLGDGLYNIGRYFPNIKKLEYVLESGEEHHFEYFSYLENLKLTLARFLSPKRQQSLLNRIWFPISMKKLTLVRCGLPWRDMSVIQALPNLEVLNLIDNAFRGSRWDACEQQFQRLKFLRLERLNIRWWETYSSSFPCLRRLALWTCYNLEGVSFEIGYISTLELIETNRWISEDVKESMKRIQKEQCDEGNTLLKIIVNGLELSEHED